MHLGEWEWDGMDGRIRVGAGMEAPAGSRRAPQSSERSLCGKSLVLDKWSF